MAVQLPPCPTSLKAIQHYLKTASEHDQRDPVVSYWCKYYFIKIVLMRVLSTKILAEV
jgi:vacuolar protein sorting-associated protein VTA1